MPLSILEACVPWRLRKVASDMVSVMCYYGNRLRWPERRAPDGRLRIAFLIPYYGYTGASQAVISSAGAIATTHDVVFRSHPTNVMNQFVPRTIRIVSDLVGPLDLCIVESGEDLALVKALIARGVRIIVTTHGAPPTSAGFKSHGYDESVMDEVMRLATSIHYISESQLPIIAKFMDRHTRQIPNFVERIVKTERTRDAGIVGDTTSPTKNAEASALAASRSRAGMVHVWGKSADRVSTDRVKWHGFSKNKAAIFNSFDVLVHLSRLDVQPLVLLEAMSAGVPCVLSNIPCFEPLRGVDGIWIVDPDDIDAATDAINQALDLSESVRSGLVRYWADHHSPEAVTQQWLAYLADVMAIPPGRV